MYLIINKSKGNFFRQFKISRIEVFLINMYVTGGTYREETGQEETSTIMEIKIREIVKNRLGIGR